MSELFRMANEAAEYVRHRLPASVSQPLVAVVLGSGLGEFAQVPRDAVTMAYRDIPHMPVSGVIGHAGELTVGRIGETPVAIFGGRVHVYEGHDVRRVTFAVRVMGLLGIKTLILTNAAGGINLAFSSGALMLIVDHVNLMLTSPLAGENDDRFGPRFPDMSEVYTKRLRGVAVKAATNLGLPLYQGVYAGMPGPNYETPAEIRYLRTIGADAVGMSTVPEAIVARHMGLDVAGISCITNMAAGVLPQPLSHQEVIDTARAVRYRFISLLSAIVQAV